MNKCRIFLISSFLIISFSSLIYSQIKLTGTLESGYYNSGGKSVVLQNGFYTGIDGQAGYTYQGSKRTASIKLRARPEFYGFNNQLKTLKLKGDLSYLENEKLFSWGINLTRQKYKFESPGLNLNYNMFSASGNFDGYYFAGSPISLNLGYAYQDIGAPNEQRLDLIFGEGKVYQTLNEYTKLGYGLYGERFTVTGSRPGPLINPQMKNNGWRYGPEVSFNYLGSGIINLDYRFLFHHSEFTNSPSMEHWIRLIAGKILTNHLSAFLLVDYFIRNFNYSENAEIYSYLLYTSMNLDNRIYAKLGYEINNNVEVYIRSGYFRENLYGNKYTFNGWNALIGIDVNN